jgi:hypothetical protein
MIAVQAGSFVRLTVGQGMPYRDGRTGDLVGQGNLDQRSFIGTVSEKSGQSLTLTAPQGGVVWEVPNSSITRLALRTGHSRSFGRTLPISMGVLGGMGGILGAVAFEPCPGGCWMGPNDRGGAFLWGFVAGAVVGIPVGLLFGFQRREVWEEVQLDSSGRHATPILAVQGDGAFVLGAAIPVSW